MPENNDINGEYVLGVLSSAAYVTSQMCGDRKKTRKQAERRLNENIMPELTKIINGEEYDFDLQGDRYFFEFVSEFQTLIIGMKYSEASKLATEWIHYVNINFRKSDLHDDEQ